MTCWR